MTDPSNKAASQAYERVGLIESLSYGLGDTGFNLYWAPLSAFLMIYLSDVVGLSMQRVGILLLVMRLAPALTDPVFAAIADRTQTVYGTYRPWLLWLAVPLAASGILAFSTASTPEDSKFIVVLVSFTILNLTYAAVMCAYNALSGVLTPDSPQRYRILSLRFATAFLSAAAITWLTPKLVSFTGPRDVSLGWQFAMTVFGVAAVMIFINVFLNTKERVLFASTPHANPLHDVKDLFTHRAWVMLFIVGFIVTFALTMRTAACAYFIKYTLGRPDLLASFAMTFSLGLACGSAISAYLTRLMSPSRVIAGALLFVSLASLLLYVTPASQTIMVFAVQAFAGLALGPVLTLTFAMCADTADDNAIKHGKRATAMTYGLFTFARRIGSALAAPLVAWALAAPGYAANTAASPALLENIRLMIGPATALLAILGAGIICAYDISPRRLTQWQAALMRGFRPVRRA